MIRRVFKGSSAYGLVRYLYGAGRRNEHTDAHMVASWDGDPTALEPLSIDGRAEVGPLVRLLEQPVRVCERAPEKYVYHLVLRTAPEDRRLSDGEWAQVCTEAMARTGIAPHDDPAGCRWVAVRHAEDHIHVVATLAREDGRPPRVWNDWRQLGQVAHEFEDTFGLRSTAALEDNTAAARPGVKEQITADAAGRRVPPRVALRLKVQTAAAASRDFIDFRSALTRAGVTVWPRMSERYPEQITGYSVSLDDWTNAAGEPVRFGGGKLAPDLSWPKLNARWAPAPTGPADTDPAGSDTPDPQSSSGPPSSETSSTPASTLRGVPLTDVEADHVWREAERIVREAAETITAEAATDPDAAADAAWAASDTLAGAAAGLEGDGGGPLTDAVAAFERAGREAHRKIPTRTDTGTALRSAGRMMTLLAPGTQHAGARANAVTVALTALMAAVADLRQAQRRLHQAQLAYTAVDQLRRVAPLPEPAVAGPQRASNAADLAAMSLARKPGKVQPYRAPRPSSSTQATPGSPDRNRDTGSGPVIRPNRSP